MSVRTPLRILLVAAPLLLLLGFAGAWIVHERDAAPGPVERKSGEAAPTAPWYAALPLRAVEGAISAGMHVRGALTRAGIPAAAADTALAALDGAGFDFRACRPGERFHALVDSAGGLYEFTYEVDRLIRWRVERLQQTGYSTARHVTPTRLDTVAIEGTLTMSVYQTLRERGETPELVAAYADVLGYDIDFVFDPREGDRFRLLVEKRMLGGECVGYGRLLGAAYDGAETGAVSGYYYRDSLSQADGWFAPDGSNLARAFMRSPLSILRVTSAFGMRTHPISGRRKMHTGIDYAAPTGTPAWSVAAGTVTFAGRKGGYGNLVEVQHAGGIRTRYGHLSRILVRRGQVVRQRQTIGRVGSTGYSTGPHLHFEYLVGGRQVAPRSIKNPPLKRIPKERMDVFTAHLRAVDARWTRLAARQAPAVAAR